ncbi:MAG: hypothetical protein ACKN9W_06060 [Methylococcus sp.]
MMYKFYSVINQLIKPLLEANKEDINDWSRVADLILNGGQGSAITRLTDIRSQYEIQVESYNPKYYWHPATKVLGSLSENDRTIVEFFFRSVVVNYLELNFSCQHKKGSVSHELPSYCLIRQTDKKNINDYNLLALLAITIAYVNAAKQALDKGEDISVDNYIAFLTVVGIVKNKSLIIKDKNDEDEGNIWNFKHQAAWSIKLLDEALIDLLYPPHTNQYSNDLPEPDAAQMYPDPSDDIRNSDNPTELIATQSQRSPQSYVLITVFGQSKLNNLKEMVERYQYERSQFKFIKEAEWFWYGLLDRKPISFEADTATIKGETLVYALCMTLGPGSIEPLPSSVQSYMDLQDLIYQIIAGKHRLVECRLLEEPWMLRTANLTGQGFVRL